MLEAVCVIKGWEVTVKTKSSALGGVHSDEQVVGWDEKGDWWELPMFQNRDMGNKDVSPSCFPWRRGCRVSITVGKFCAMLKYSPWNESPGRLYWQLSMDKGYLSSVQGFRIIWVSSITCFEDMLNNLSVSSSAFTDFQIINWSILYYNRPFFKKNKIFFENRSHAKGFYKY